MPRRVMYRVVESTSEEEGFKSSSLIQTGPEVQQTEQNKGTIQQDGLGVNWYQSVGWKVLLLVIYDRS